MSQTKKSSLDSIDRKLVNLLLKDARASFKTLAAEVGLTSPACAERVRRLREEGVINGYRADVDWRMLGFHINALIRIGAAAEHGQAMLEVFNNTPNVIEVLRVTGTDSYVVHVLARSSEELEQVVDTIGRLGVVNTSVILSSPLSARQRLARLLEQTVLPP